MTEDEKISFIAGKLEAKLEDFADKIKSMIERLDSFNSRLAELERSHRRLYVSHGSLQNKYAALEQYMPKHFSDNPLEPIKLLPRQNPDKMYFVAKWWIAFYRAMRKRNEVEFDGEILDKKWLFNSYREYCIANKVMYYARCKSVGDFSKYVSYLGFENKRQSTPDKNGKRPEGYKAPFIDDAHYLADQFVSKQDGVIRKQNEAGQLTVKPWDIPGNNL